MVFPAIVMPPQVPEVVREPKVRYILVPAAGLRLSIPVQVIVPANLQIAVPVVGAIVIVEEPDKVPAYPVRSKDRQLAAESITMLPVEASNATLVVEVGADPLTQVAPVFQLPPPGTAKSYQIKPVLPETLVHPLAFQVAPP